MAKEYTHVRIETATLKELERVRESMLVAEDMGLVTLAKDARDRFSLDQVITRLIAFREKHKERVRRAKARRALRRRPAAPETSVPMSGVASLPDEGAGGSPPPPPFTDSSSLFVGGGHAAGGLPEGAGAGRPDADP